MNSQECCNQDCNQGRDCPKRNLSEEITEGFKALEVMRNNEPVAWIKQNPETLEAELHFDKPAKYWATVISNPDIPLYTHPAKTLTDEEIQQIWLEFDARNTNDWFIAIARAILRKAQEK
jgi:hypothetical protein